MPAERPRAERFIVDLCRLRFLHRRQAQLEIKLRARAPTAKPESHLPGSDLPGSDLPGSQVPICQVPVAASPRRETRHAQPTGRLLTNVFLARPDTLKDGDPDHRDDDRAQLAAHDRPVVGARHCIQRPVHRRRNYQEDGARS